MKKIIVPIDFSPESLCGLKLAIIFANRLRADIQMVYVQTKQSSFFGAEIEHEYEKAQEQFTKVLAEYKKDVFQECDFSFIIKKGRIYEEVVKQVEAFDNSVVICSTHGVSGFTRFFVGSNTYRIIEATDRPVISITNCQYIREIKKIVMPIDVSIETREKVPLVARIAKAFGAEVHIVKVTSSTNEGIHNKLRLYSRQIRQYFDQNGIKYEKSLLVGDNITEITIDYAKTIDADLIAIMTEQTTTLSNLLLGSYALQMLNESPIPVLSVTSKQLHHVHSFTAGG
ncbi:MAG: universal stress protein [Bacteroidales bacterium]|nr:universal stress protein [Bacteroidales bacterium]HOY39154.1 universal stress protein [Bacteroidales bacterium]HQP05035.1 universal stress protein [Bacteroidales bacterium]